MAVVPLIIAVALLQGFTEKVAATKEYGCHNSLISDEWREMMEKLQNDLRRRLSKGEQPGKSGTLPAANKMYEMMGIPHADGGYDVYSTPRPNMKKGKGGKDGRVISHDDHNQNYNMNCKRKGGGVYLMMTTIRHPHCTLTYFSKLLIKKDRPCNPTDLAKKEINRLWNEGAQKQVNETRVQDNDIFSRMAYSENNGFACSYHDCGSSGLNLVCFYDKNGTTANNLYTKNATACGGCTDCIDGLCPKDFSTPTIPSIACPACGEAHGYFREIALYMHNYYRRILATGWGEDKQINYAKPAKAMIELTYDSALEKAARDYVHNNGGNCPDRASSGTGENFYLDNDYELNHKQLVAKAITTWWSALKDKGLGDQLLYDESQADDVKALANMIHDKTMKIGCGARTCKKQGINIVDCRYSPILSTGQAVYDVGKRPCNPCPTNTTCSKLGGLCAY